MEYLMALFGLGVLCGCAIGAYAELDALEREEENCAPLTDPPPRPQEQRERGSGVVTYADWLEGRVRRLEERLDRIESNRARQLR